MTSLPDAEDAPFEITATTRYDAARLRDIYDRLEALAREVVALRNSNGPYCYPKADPDGSTIPKGYAVAIKHTGAEPLLVPFTSANVTAGASFVGVLVEDAAPGSRAKVQTSGAISRNITGLSTGSNEWVKADSTTGQLTRDAALGGSDLVVGRVNTQGDITVFSVDFANPPVIGGNTPAEACLEKIYVGVNGYAGPSVQAGGDASAASVEPEGSLYFEDTGALFASNGTDFAPVQQMRSTNINLSDHVGLTLTQCLVYNLLKVGPTGIGKVLTGPDLSSAYWMTRPIVMIVHNNGANAIDVQDFNSNNAVGVVAGAIKTVLFYNDYVYDIT